MRLPPSPLVMVAESEGFFAREGLRVNPKGVDLNKTVVDQMLRGEVSEKGLCHNDILLVSRTTYIATHADAVDGLLSALLASEHFSERHLDEVKQAYAERTEAPHDDLAEVWGGDSIP